MKWRWFLSLLPILSLASCNLLACSAVAQCVQADISVQYNISGSRSPTERSNDVQLASDGSCRGNATVTTGVQGNVGGNRRVRQTRKVRQRSANTNSHTRYSGNTVQIKSNAAIDVYNPVDRLSN